MRVLHVGKFLHRRGGAEAHLLDLADLQRARGDEVAFFGMTHPDNPRLQGDWRRAVVRQANGTFAVNYATLGLRMATLEEWTQDSLASVLCREEELRLAA